MWEQIVVDTGSSDRTAELAREMGAKVFSLEWEDDFSAAKNYAIDRAEGEWIAFLDADEYLSEEDAGKLPEALKLISGDGYDVLSAGLYNLDMAGKIISSCTHFRFFRNHPDIRYRRRIHEQLVSLSGRKLRIMDGTGELSIFHTGYQENVLKEKKQNRRNRRLILRELEENPNDYEMLSYMGDECFGAGDRKEAEEWYRRAVRVMPVKTAEYQQRNAATFARLLLVLTEDKDVSWKDVECIYRQAAEALPEESDFDYIAGRFFALRGQPEQAAGYLEQALKKLSIYGNVNKASVLTGNLEDAYYLLARCAYDLGAFQKCVTYTVGYLKYNKYEMRILMLLLKVLVSDEAVFENAEAMKQVDQFLSRLYDLSSLKDRLFLVKTAEKTECDRLAAYFLGCLFSSEERKALEL